MIVASGCCGAEVADIQKQYTFGTEREASEEPQEGRTSEDRANASAN